MTIKTEVLLRVEVILILKTKLRLMVEVLLASDVILTMTIEKLLTLIMEVVFFNWGNKNNDIHTRVYWQLKQYWKDHLKRYILRQLSGNWQCYMYWVVFHRDIWGVTDSWGNANDWNDTNIWGVTYRDILGVNPHDIWGDTDI